MDGAKPTTVISEVKMEASANGYAFRSRRLRLARFRTRRRKIDDGDRMLPLLPHREIVLEDAVPVHGFFKNLRVPGGESTCLGDIERRKLGFA